MLTRRKQLFIDYYISTKNATQSAISAGYSSRTAYSQGQRLLKNVEVKTEVDLKFEQIKEEEGINRDNILKRLWNISKTAKPSSQVNALMGIAKIIGIIIDKAEVFGTQTLTIEQKTQELNDLLVRMKDRLNNNIGNSLP